MTPAPAEGRNVVVVVIDTLRADHLPFYGYSKDTAPFLSTLAERAVVFDSAYATSTWTAPSTASLFTSLYPKDHGVKTGLRTLHSVADLGIPVELNRIPPKAETLPEWMAGWGYRTYAFADNPNLDAPMGFARGFDHFSTGINRGANVVRDEVLAARDELVEGKRPFFLYLHFMDPHMPYVQQADGYDLEDTIARPGYQEDMACYDSEIRHVDTVLAELWKALDLDHNSLVVIAADHGEEFGDHGRGAHGAQLYNELLHVPLLIQGTDKDGAPLFPAQRVPEPVSLLDVLPTLRGLLGAPPAATDSGFDLSGRLAGSAPARERLLFPERTMELEIFPFEVRAVIDGDFKYYTDTREEQPSLYQMALDPTESKDLASTDPERTARLAAALAAHLAEPALFERSYTAPKALGNELHGELEKLGYGGE